MITPMDIHNREFKKGFRGYAEEDVDAFMTQIASDYEVVFRDNREMKEAIEQLREKLTQYEQMESTMNNTLVLAQETAENVRASARKEAELIVQTAELQKNNMLQETLRSLRDGQEKYEMIRNDVAVFRAKMESLLKSHQQLLDQTELPACRVDAIGAAIKTSPFELAEDEVAFETTEKSTPIEIEEVIAAEAVDANELNER